MSDVPAPRPFPALTVYRWVAAGIVLQAALAAWVVSSPQSASWAELLEGLKINVPLLTRVYVVLVNLAAPTATKLFGGFVIATLYLGDRRLRHGSLTPLYVALGVTVVASVGFCLMVAAVILPLTTLFVSAPE